MHQAEAIFVKLNASVELTRVKRYQATLLLFAGRHAEAFVALSQFRTDLLKRLDEVDLTDQVIQSLRFQLYTCTESIGITLRELGALQQAEEEFLIAFDQAQNLGLFEKATTRLNLAKLYLKWDRLTEARTHLEFAIQSYDELQNQQYFQYALAVESDIALAASKISSTTNS